MSAPYRVDIIEVNGATHSSSNPLYVSSVSGSAIIGKVGIDQTTPGTTNGVQVLAGTAYMGQVGGTMTTVSTEFTRPADTNAYAANDCVSNSTSSTTVQTLTGAARASGKPGYITAIRLTTDKKSITPRFRVHFFNATNPTVSADNAAWQDKYADVSKRLGYWDLTAMTTGADTTNSDMSRAIDMTCRIPFVPADANLYFVLETLDAFTPASGQKFTLTISTEQY